MKNRIAACILTTCIVAASAIAADKIDIRTLEQRSLPAEVYNLLKPGKRSSLFWRDASFVLASSYSVEKVDWLAVDRNGSLLDSLTKQLQSLSQKDGAQYRVQVRVTTYVPAVIKTFGKNVQPRIVVEAVILDKNGAAVAAMVTSEKGDLGKHPKADAETFNGMVDKVVAGLDSEVMKGR